jgi:hypothetical protein
MNDSGCYITTNFVVHTGIGNPFYDSEIKNGPKTVARMSDTENAYRIWWKSYWKTST